jgi:hypothetical protein
MMKPMVLGAVLSLMVSSTAWAVPAASPGPQLGAHSSDVLKVGRGDHDKDRYGKKGEWRGNHAFRDDDRYRGKKRYSYRPDDWEERGCISIGPFWYCS